MIPRRIYIETDPVENQVAVALHHQGVIRTLDARGETVIDRSTSLRVPQLTGFGQDGRHRLYATSLSGRVYRILVAAR